MNENDVTDVTLTILIDKSLKKRFKKAVFNNDDTLKSVLTEAVIDYLVKYEVV